MRLAAFALAIACGLGSPSVVLAPTARALPPVPRLAIRQPEPSGTPQPQETQQTIGDYLAGRATWYPARSTVAAAGPELRAALGPNWRGTTVRVCAGSVCLTEVLLDWCLCTGSPHRLIDLPAVDFARLAPLSRGLVAIEVTPNE